MFGLSLTSNLKHEEARAHVLEDMLEKERGGIDRFKVAVIHFDAQKFEAEVRGKIDPSIWVESNGDRVVVFSARPLTEAEKNAVVAWMPKPERL